MLWNSRFFLVLILTAFVAAAAVRTEAQIAPHRCAAPEYRQFDFWVGDWEVHDADGALEGNNRITLDEDGCVLTEHWSSPGQTGVSLTMYDFREKRWTQSWYDSFGNLLIISGVFRDGSVVLEGSRATPEGRPAVERCRWAPLPDGRVHQYWDTSEDGGKTWKKHFEGFYTRRKESSMSDNKADEARLRELNQQYVDAFMNADVAWYQKHLAEDFLSTESDGSRLNKQEFLRLTEKGPDVLDYRLEQVDVRILGNAALVHATGLFTRKDHTKGRSRYTDVYVRTGQEWKAVSAQVTRTQVTGQ